MVATPELTFNLDNLGFEIPDWLRTSWEKREVGKVACGSRLFDAAELDLICRAFVFAYSLHAGQRRRSGEPYIIHPIHVAGLLWDLGSDAAMIAAAFLHDIIEDTDVTGEDLQEQFNPEVRSLVEGVTKLSKLNFSSKTEQLAENFRRMFLAMAKDIRVIVIKLADRLHNMRTLEHMPEAKQKQIAKETLDIFAPLANRLGIWHFKWELEDLAFKYSDGEAYRNIQNLVNAKQAEREADLHTFMTELSQRLTADGISHFEVSGRPKHLYSIYKKMQRQRKPFEEIYDLSAVRVLVDTLGECYMGLGAVHRCYSVMPNRFKDYISVPKPNRYQSLHTTVMTPYNRPIEVQIRTWEMHHIAEYGIAAHWKYKEKGNSLQPLNATEEKFVWLRQLLEFQNDLRDDLEYLENLRDTLFEGEVYAFTPKGDVYALPRGACPVDFAYRIHSEVGNHCNGAKINGRIVPLDTCLRNGDIVEILTQNNAHPSLDWINFVATSSAKNRIRQWFKLLHRDDNIIRGRQLLERELGKTGLDSLLKSKHMQQVVERLNYTQCDDLLAGLGYGELTVTSVVNKLRELNLLRTVTPQPEPERPAPQAAPPTVEAPKGTIAGVESLLYHLARCCNPLPGDSILGVVGRAGRGIAIHRDDCQNILDIPSDRHLYVQWSSQTKQQVYPVVLRLDVVDRVGILKDVTARISESNINVSNANVKTRNGMAVITVRIDVHDRHQLDRIVNQLHQLADVFSVRRL